MAVWALTVDGVLEGNLIRAFESLWDHFEGGADIAARCISHVDLGGVVKARIAPAVPSALAVTLR